LRDKGKLTLMQVPELKTLSFQEFEEFFMFFFVDTIDHGSNVGVGIIGRLFTGIRRR